MRSPIILMSSSQGYHICEKLEFRNSIEFFFFHGYSKVRDLILIFILIKMQNHVLTISDSYYWWDDTICANCNACLKWLNFISKKEINERSRQWTSWFLPPTIRNVLQSLCLSHKTSPSNSVLFFPLFCHLKPNVPILNYRIWILWKYNVGML